MGFGPPVEKSQVAIGFLRNTGTDLYQEAILPQLLLEGGLYGPL